MSLEASNPPVVASVEMGYGHLRAARPIAEALGSQVLHVDRDPLAGPEERRLWQRVRRAYEWTSRISQTPGLGAPLRWVFDRITDIPHLYPYRDLSAPTRGALELERLFRRGLGEGLVAMLRSTGAPLVTTFYSPALAAARAGLDRVYCVVTDTDINRVWAPLEPGRTAIHYLVPSQRAARRLRSYGVPEERITFTGFPLPHALVGGPKLSVLQRTLAARLVRLDPVRTFRRYFGDELAHFLGPLPSDQEGKAPLVAFAVGGAGAQSGLARLFLPSFRPALEAGRLRLALVAGVRPEVVERFQDALAASGLVQMLGRGVEIVAASSMEEYFRRFEALLAEVDVLWTKPSELTFYAALGLPLVCGPPVGVHERYNRRWAREGGAGLKQRDPRFAGEWLADWLADGTLAGAAWSGFMRLPKLGLYHILEALGVPAPSWGTAAPDERAS
jgi:hypothetical protein